MVTVEPAYAQRRDGNLLPQDKSGQVTAVGCLVQGDAVRGGKKDKYVLARPRKGPVASVPEASCTADPGADALTLDNPEKANITDAMVGHWVEISGRLESETDKNPDNLRELDVLTAKMVPVVVPPRRLQQLPPALNRRPRQRRARHRHRHRRRRLHLQRHPQSSRKLPKTASQVPAIGLAGLLSLAAGLILRSFRLRHEVEQRTQTTTEGTTAHAVAPFVEVR